MPIGLTLSVHSWTHIKSPSLHQTLKHNSRLMDSRVPSESTLCTNLFSTYFSLIHISLSDLKPRMKQNQSIKKLNIRITPRNPFTTACKGMYLLKKQHCFTVGCRRWVWLVLSLSTAPRRSCWWCHFPECTAAGDEKKKPTEEKVNALNKGVWSKSLRF